MGNIHTPKAVTYHEQSHYCRFMIGHSLGRVGGHRRGTFASKNIPRIDLTLDVSQRLRSHALQNESARSNMAAMLSTFDTSHAEMLLLKACNRSQGILGQCAAAKGLQQVTRDTGSID